MLKITAPERINWDLSYALPVRCEGDFLNSGECVLVAVRLESGLVQSVRPAFTEHTGLVDLRHCLDIPWRDGTLLVTLLRRNRISNRVRIRLEKSEFAFRDPEVDKFVAVRKRRARPLPIWPNRGQGVAASELPYYRRLPESPEVPEQIGIALTVAGTVVRASFRLRLLDIDIVPVTDREGNKFGYLRTTAVVPITLLIAGSENHDPIKLDLAVPSYSEIEPSAKDRTANGFFALDLSEMNAITPPGQPGFLYAFSGESMAGPAAISV